MNWVYEEEKRKAALEAWRDFQRGAHRIASQNGFHDVEQNDDFQRRLYISEALMLISTEISEAFEELRAGHGVDELYWAADRRGILKPEGVPVELADVVIRIADFAENYGIDLASAIEHKMAYNQMREHKHGKVF